MRKFFNNPEYADLFTILSSRSPSLTKIVKDSLRAIGVTPAEFSCSGDSRPKPQMTLQV